MTVQIRRTWFDFAAKDYETTTPKITVFPDGLPAPAGKPLGTPFVMRWYLGLDGEDKPSFSSVQATDPSNANQFIYRYDWVFGITLIEGYYWDWLAEMPDGFTLAVHLVLQPLENAAEAVPVAAAMRGLYPSRSTTGFWEQVWTRIPAAAAGAAKLAGSVHPLMGLLGDGLSMASSVSDAQDNKKKNWFLYQFFDEKLCAPTVEWRINKNVFREYGPLLRGSLYLGFYGSRANAGIIRLKLRPQLSYTLVDDISFMIPTNEPGCQQVSIDLMPQEQGPTETATP
jgi:hypothetical protein